MRETRIAAAGKYDLNLYFAYYLSLKIFICTEGHTL